jgi:hypothetical protein
LAIGFAAPVVTFGGDRRASLKEAMGGGSDAMNLTRHGEGGASRGLRRGSRGYSSASRGCMHAGSRGLWTWSMRGSG